MYKITLFKLRKYLKSKYCGLLTKFFGVMKLYQRIYYDVLIDVQTNILVKSIPDVFSG